MKIVLISPYEGLQAIGLRILSSCLKHEGHDVNLLFLSKPFTERFSKTTLKEIVKFSGKSDLVGISLMTNYFDSAVQITQEIKKHLDVPIIWGGVHPTVRPEESLNYADIICLGEGEEAIIELLAKMENGQDYSSVRNMWLKNGDKIIKNQLRPLIQDLNILPFQDYAYKNHYILIRDSFQKINIDSLSENLNREYMTMATRGCPFGCAYCFNNTFNELYSGQKPLRRRNIDNVIQELQEVKTNLPFFKTIKLDDDNFFSYTKIDIKYFCEQYKSKIGLPLIITGAVPSALSREQMSILIDAGLVGLRMGIQTASSRTKKMYNRRHTNEQVEKACRIINEFKHAIRPQYDIIVDNPYEDDENIVETLMFLSKLPVPYILAIYSLNFYPGTELYRKAKKDGIIKDDLNEIYRKYYHKCRDTYLNKLFFLLEKYARNNYRISPALMSLLTNKRMQILKLNSILYFVLLVWTATFIPKRAVHLLRQSIQDVKRGDWLRIRRKIKGYFR